MADPHSTAPERVSAVRRLNYRAAQSGALITSRRSSGSLRVTPRWSSSSRRGTATRRVVPSARRASATVKGCGSLARILAACESAPATTRTTGADRRGQRTVRHLCDGWDSDCCGEPAVLAARFPALRAGSRCAAGWTRRAPGGQLLPGRRAQRRRRRAEVRTCGDGDRGPRPPLAQRHRPRGVAIDIDQAARYRHVEQPPQTHRRGLRARGHRVRIARPSVQAGQGQRRRRRDRCQQGAVSRRGL